MSNTPRFREHEGCAHTLKCWPQFFDLTWQGLKPFELRKNDRRPYFMAGDTVTLREWEPHAEYYTGRSIRCLVTCVITEGPWLKAGFAALGLERLGRMDTGIQTRGNGEPVAAEQVA